jgi:hypothetical protein
VRGLYSDQRAYTQLIGKLKAASSGLVTGLKSSPAALRYSLHHPSTLVSHPSRRCRYPLALPIALESRRLLLALMASWPNISAPHHLLSSLDSPVTVGVTWYDHFAAPLALCSYVLTSCARPLRVMTLLRFVSGTELPGQSGIEILKSY